MAHTLSGLTSSLVAVCRCSYQFVPFRLGRDRRRAVLRQPADVRALNRLNESDREFDINTFCRLVEEWLAAPLVFLLYFVAHSVSFPGLVTGSVVYRASLHARHSPADLPGYTPGERWLFSYHPVDRVAGFFACFIVRAILGLS